MNELEMSGWCNLGLHYDCGEFDEGECECPCHEGDT